jgi:hypothetical protein
VTVVVHGRRDGGVKRQEIGLARLHRDRSVTRDVKERNRAVAGRLAPARLAERTRLQVEITCPQRTQVRCSCGGLETHFVPVNDVLRLLPVGLYERVYKTTLGGRHGKRCIKGSEEHVLGRLQHQSIPLLHPPPDLALQVGETIPEIRLQRTFGDGVRKPFGFAADKVLHDDVHLVSRCFRDDVGDFSSELHVLLHVQTHVFVVCQDAKLAVLRAVDDVFQVMQHQQQRLLLRYHRIPVDWLVGVETLDDFSICCPCTDHRVNALVHLHTQLVGRKPAFGHPPARTDAAGDLVLAKLQRLIREAVDLARVLQPENSRVVEILRQHGELLDRYCVVFVISLW